MENREQQNAEQQNQDILEQGVLNYNKKIDNLYKKIEEIEVGFMQYQLQEKERFDKMINSLREHMTEYQQQFEKNVGEIFEARQQQMMRITQLEEMQQRFNVLMGQYQQQQFQFTSNNNYVISDNQQYTYQVDPNFEQKNQQL